MSGVALVTPAMQLPRDGATPAPADAGPRPASVPGAQAPAQPAVASSFGDALRARVAVQHLADAAAAGHASAVAASAETFTTDPSVPLLNSQAQWQQLSSGQTSTTRATQRSAATLAITEFSGAPAHADEPQAAAGTPRDAATPSAPSRTPMSAPLPAATLTDPTPAAATVAKRPAGARDAASTAAAMQPAAGNTSAITATRASATVAITPTKSAAGPMSGAVGAADAAVTPPALSTSTTTQKTTSRVSTPTPIRTRAASKPAAGKPAADEAASAGAVPTPSAATPASAAAAMSGVQTPASNSRDAAISPRAAATTLRVGAATSPAEPPRSVAAPVPAPLRTGATPATAPTSAGLATREAAGADSAIATPGAATDAAAPVAAGAATASRADQALTNDTGRDPAAADADSESGESATATAATTSIPSNAASIPSGALRNATSPALDATGHSEAAGRAATVTDVPVPALNTGPVHAAADAAPTAPARQTLVQALADHLQVHMTNGGQSAVIRLDPPSMGSIDILIRRDAGAVQVHLTASNGEVLTQLQAIGDALRQDLSQRHQGQVSVQVSDGSRDAGGKQRQAQGGQPQPGRALGEAEDDEQGATFDWRALRSGGQ